MTEKAILFSTEISPAAANNFAAILAGCAVEKIDRLILAMNSSGGNVMAGVFLHNLIRTMPYEVVVHNVGNIDSIANVIFVAADVRRSTPGATFMWHGVGFNGNPNERLEEKNLKEKMDVVKADHKRLSTLVAGRTNLSERQVRNLFSQQSTRGAEWAADVGIVHEVADFIYPRNGSLLTFFG